MHQSSLEQMLAFRTKYLESRKDEALLILDLGSLDVNGSYKGCFEIDSWTYRGIDMAAGKNVDIVLKDPYCWREIKSDSADVLVSGQAFEHIEFFWLTMLEITRVLKPGGLCCLVAPSGGPVHRYPVDCWRFYPDGFTALARFASLEVSEVYSRTEAVTYTDDSHVWNDTVLVCRKPVLPTVSSWKRNFSHWLLCQLLREPLRQARPMHDDQREA